MSSIWNNKISVSIFGEDEGPAIGVMIDELPANEHINAEEISRFMQRRSENKNVFSPSPRIMSGMTGERTTGAPLCAFIHNTASPVRREPAQEHDVTVRRGNADYTGAIRYRGYEDVRESAGHYTEKMTLPLCFAGAVCGQILERRGIYTGAHVLQIHTVKDNPFDPVAVSRDAVISIRDKEFPVINDRKGWMMSEDIAMAAEAGESLGGIIECAVINLPAGVGAPIFNGLKNSISQLIFSIPGVRGLEFGSGFDSSKMIGSQCEDEFYTDERGYSVTKTNNHGGIIGGISTGMPVLLKAAINPDMSDSGRTSYCPCRVPYLVPCIEAAVNIAILSHMLDYPNFC